MADDLSRIDWDSPPEGKDLAPRKPDKVLVTTLSIRPEVAKLLEDSTTLLGNQLRAYLQKQGEGGSLSPQEVSALSRLVDSVAKLSREEREVNRRKEPYSERELLDIVRELLNEGVIDVRGE